MKMSITFIGNTESDVDHQQQQPHRKTYPEFFGLMSRFTIFTLFTIYTIFAAIVSLVAAKEEGEFCSMKNINGTCMATSKCYDRIDEYIRSGRLTEDDVVSCGLGPREEIICCPVERAIKSFDMTTQRTTRTTTARTATGTVTKRPLKIGNNLLDQNTEYYDFQNLLGRTTRLPDVQQPQPGSSSRVVNNINPNQISFGQQTSNSNSNSNAWQQNSFNQNVNTFGIPNFNPQQNNWQMNNGPNSWMEQQRQRPPVQQQQQFFDQNQIGNVSPMQNVNFLPGGDWTTMNAPQPWSNQQNPSVPTMEQQLQQQQWLDIERQQQFPNAQRNQNNLQNINFVPTDQRQQQQPQRVIVNSINSGGNKLLNQGFQSSTPKVFTDPFKPFEFQGNDNPNSRDFSTNIGGGTVANGGGGDGIGIFTDNTKGSSEFNTRGSAGAAEQACERLEAGLPKLLSPHIIGGISVKPKEYPHMAAIAFTSIGGGNESYVYRCGGTLIDTRFVLTAAHCVINVEISPVHVRLGMLNISEPLNGDGQEIKVKEVRIHPDYVISSKYNDIALLELAEDAKKSEAVYPACLYTELTDPPNTYEYYVAGWGSVNFRLRSVSSILLKARLKIEPLESCNQSIADANSINRKLAHGVIETQLCAFDRERDACQGDSGGPLIQVHDATRKSFRIVGIVSAGFGCNSNTPGLYTRVAAYISYIESIVWPQGV